MSVDRHGEHVAALGSAFHIAIPGRSSSGDMTPGVDAVDLILSEVSGTRQEGPYVGWSLLFAGTATDQLPQGVYEASNQLLGNVELFLVPIGNDGEHAVYESTFSVAP